MTGLNGINFLFVYSIDRRTSCLNVRIQINTSVGSTDIVKLSKTLFKLHFRSMFMLMNSRYSPTKNKNILIKSSNSDRFMHKTSHKLVTGVRGNTYFI